MSTAYLPEFAGTYLEDSYLLGVIAHGRDLRLKMLFALTTEHPEYEAPEPGERHCYREGHLIVERPTIIGWIAGKPILLTDPNGTLDLGGVELHRIGTTRFRIITDWFDTTVETVSLTAELLSG